MGLFSGLICIGRDGRKIGIRDIEQTLGMKTVLAITIVFLLIVFCNCGTSQVNSGNYSPQTATPEKLTGISSPEGDTLNHRW